MNTASQPLVSVVTPVYNGAEHLTECIESVLAQTYQKWDYTILDNCSTDGSAELARRYAAKDRRIRVRENRQFLRVIPNHNVALRQISPASKYCKLVFADDWIFPECLEQMVTLAEEEPSVGIVAAFSLQERQVTLTGLPYPSRCVGGRDIGRQIFLGQLYGFGSANSVLYRADLVRSQDPFYNESNIHADTEVIFALLKTCDLGFVHQVLTFTRMRAGSLSTISGDIGTGYGGMLHILLTHGPDYLTPVEFQMCLDRLLSEHYSFLGKSLVFGRDKKFWDYHKRKLVEEGVGFSRARLARATLAVLFNAALNPKDAIEKLRKRGGISHVRPWLLRRRNSY
jgi:hypothetical protein